MPEKDLQTRWFAEPLHYLTIGPKVFQKNNGGYPALSKHHQELIFTYMRLKAAPWILLCDIGPDVSNFKVNDSSILSDLPPSTEEDFPTLAEAHSPSNAVQNHQGYSKGNEHMEYLRWLEMQQPPVDLLDSPTLRNFQDWLQSPLQPLSDNLESGTYEVFEGDPVKYNQYEAAVIEALKEWKELKLPTSQDGVVVIAVAGSGRGPLVTRALKAAEHTGVPVKVWAVEKNPNAYVYLLRQNQTVWGGKVNVVKTDMRAWKGPIVSQSAESGAVYEKVDILISELLGSFGDNELSPECLDGIQHVMAEPHGISIPHSYTAHFSPISTPKLYGDILARSSTDDTAFDTPWVVRLYALDFVSQRVPGHPKIQLAWEFSHPIPESTLQSIQARRSGGTMGGGGGSMAGAAGANDHNSRHCHVTFVCRTRGVVHGLAGYFESTLYESKLKDTAGEKVEISTHPERIDKKSKDMISWFPIFFSLKVRPSARREIDFYPNSAHTGTSFIPRRYGARSEHVETDRRQQGVVRVAGRSLDLGWANVARQGGVFWSMHKPKSCLHHVDGRLEYDVTELDKNDHNLCYHTIFRYRQTKIKLRRVSLSALPA